ncbi:MAG: hypothetical protein QOF61_2553 [Acidobacteriota bacterium]|jgi:hypothetical protein|nr:hypothetical protein [Acidobacteriota bacterium]
MKKSYSHARRAATMFAAACALVVAASAQSAQDDWTQKPYNQWTMKEVEQILSDSPWAQTRGKGIDPGVSVSDFPLGMSVDSEDITLRLRSALPVRQAFARLRQLKAKYDAQSDKAKASIDEKTKVLLECPACADNYVVTLSPAPGRDKGVPSALRQMSLAELKLNVTLTDERGTKRELVHFVPQKSQGDEATFFFERYDEKGAPLFTPSSKKVVIQFAPKIFGGRGTTITKFEFDVTKMLVAGQVAF